MFYKGSSNFFNSTPVVEITVRVIEYDDVSGKYKFMCSNRGHTPYLSCASLPPLKVFLTGAYET